MSRYPQLQKIIAIKILILVEIFIISEVLVFAEPETKYDSYGTPIDESSRQDKKEYDIFGTPVGKAPPEKHTLGTILEDIVGSIKNIGAKKRTEQRLKMLKKQQEERDYEDLKRSVDKLESEQRRAKSERLIFGHELP